jgi:hypothetical protein
MKKAITVLARGYEHDIQYKDLVIRNKFIEENLVDKENTDILIFNEGNISESNKESLQRKTSLTLKFISIPKFDPIPNISFDPESSGYNWGYRHMCNFWFIDFHKYLKDYELMLRVDDDCIVDSSIDNIFYKLENVVSIFAKMGGDWEFVTKNMNNLTKTFLNTSESKGPGGPSTNLIGFNLNKLRNNHLFFEYIEKVKESQGIYIYRWGDMPLWGEVLEYFYTPNDYIIDQDIKYYHGSHADLINWP